MDQNPTDDTRITRAIVGVLLEHDLSGFEIWQWLGSVHGVSDALNEASVYPTLYRLEEQRLIEGSWHEGEGTRRRYRITATGLRLATREGWGPVANWRSRGTWRRANGSGAGEGFGLDGPGEADGEWAWPYEMPAPPDHKASPTGSLEAVAVDTYLDALQKALRLSPAFCSDVCHEIADHIADASARRRALGGTPADAVTATLEALEPPETLAERVNQAQLTRHRLRRGLSWASAVATLTGMVGFAVAFDVIQVAVPWILGLIVPIFKQIGIHLYAPVTAEWDSQTFAVALCIGAFVSARRSMPFLADRSRQSDKVVWRTWAIAGGLPLIAIAMLAPVNFDPLSALLMLGPPLAWALGTRRPAPLYGETITTKGLALCIVAATVVTFLPGGRIWYYDSATHPAADARAANDAAATLVWLGPVGSPDVQATVSDLPDGWHDATIQVWPATRIGPVIVPDSAAPGPTLVVPAGAFVDFATLPRGQPDWWITVAAVGPDGHSYVVDNEVRFGYPYPTRTTIMAWLLGLF